MKPYLSETLCEDELVRVITTDYEKLLAGCNTDRVRMPNEVVPLSLAMETIEEYIADLEERGANRRTLTFYVEACKDDFLLFVYHNNEIREDHRGEERLKSSEKV